MKKHITTLAIVILLSTQAFSGELLKTTTNMKPIGLGALAKPGEVKSVCIEDAWAKQAHKDPVNTFVAYMKKTIVEEKDNQDALAKSCTDKQISGDKDKASIKMLCETNPAFPLKIKQFYAYMDVQKKSDAAIDVDIKYNDAKSGQPFLDGKVNFEMTGKSCDVKTFKPKS